MSNFLSFTHTPQPRNSGNRCPDQLYRQLKSWRPSYAVNGSVVSAKFENVTYWRDTNEWAAYYWMTVRGPRGMATEKFVWTFRHGRFVELCQFKPRGTQWRQFAG